MPARVLFAAALLVAMVIGSRAIREEGTMSVLGDMPRYLMDGVFLYDFVSSGAPCTFPTACVRC